MYKNALVAKQQLEEVGIAVDLQVVDWATLNHRTEKPELWEVFSTGFVFSADPANHVALPLHVPGLVVQRGEGAAARPSCRCENDLKKRKAIVDRIQTVFYEDVGQRQARATTSRSTSRAASCAGDFRTAPRLYFWNSWLGGFRQMSPRRRRGRLARAARARTFDARSAGARRAAWS